MTCTRFSTLVQLPTHTSLAGLSRMRGALSAGWRPALCECWSRRMQTPHLLPAPWWHRRSWRNSSAQPGVAGSKVLCCVVLPL